MRKFIAAMVAGMLLSVAAYAETDYVAMPVINDIQKGVNNANQIQKLRVKESVTLGGNVTSASNITVAAGGITITAGGQTITAGGQTITVGGQTITAGDQTISAGTSKVDKVEALLTGMTGVTIAGLPKNYFTFFDEFFSIGTSTNLTETDNLNQSWVFTSDTGVTTSLVVGATAGGVLQIKTGHTDNNETYIQYGPQTTEGMVSIVSNGAKKVWFETRVNAPTPGSEGGFFVGLADPASSAADFLVDDSGLVDTNKNHMGFWIGTTKSNAFWKFQAEKADVALVGVENVVTNTAGTYVRLGFYYDGVNLLRVYANGTANARVFTNDAVSYPDSVVMSPIVAIKTGVAAAVATGKVDYIWIQQER